MLEELLTEIPQSVLALLRIPNLGPKKAAVLFNELKIENLDQLRAACEAGEVENLKGFGKKTQDKILAGIDLAARADERIYWAKADAVAQELLAHMKQVLTKKKQIELAGSYRRGKETIGDLDLLVEGDEPIPIMDHFGNFEEGAEVLARGDTKMSIRLSTGLQVDLRVVPSASFGAALQYFTGSKDHNVILRGMAKDRGLLINEWGVFQVSKKTGADAEEKETFTSPKGSIAGKTEEEVYSAIGLPYFPPEIREARQEFEWAAAGELPKLIELSDIRGDLHMHTSASDGKGTILEMSEAARARGLEYIAITDHSKRVFMANGLDGSRLREQWQEVDRINRSFGDSFRILKGVECDILEKGGMDLPDDVLAEADWVIASVHYGQNQSRDQITDRILGALANPHVDIIAHPTGRLINKREPYEVDMEAVIQAAKEHGKMLELNANPARLDLHDIHCAAAKRYGVPVVISTDAHSEDGLNVMRCGILQARRGGLTIKDVANTKKLEGFLKLLSKH